MLNQSWKKAYCFMLKKIIGLTSKLNNSQVDVSKGTLFQVAPMKSKWFALLRLLREKHYPQTWGSSFIGSKHCSIAEALFFF